MAIISSRKLTLEADELFYRLEKIMSLVETPSTLLEKLKWKKELLLKDEKISILENMLVETVLEKISTNNALIEKHRDEIDLLKEVFHVDLKKPAKTPKKSILLSEAIELYFDVVELKRRKDKLSTVRKDKDVLKLFMDIVGDKPMSEIKQPDAVKFSKEAITFGCKYKPIRAESTVNGFMNSINKFSAWIIAFHSEAEHVKLDFSRLRYKKSKKPSEERDMFTDEEVIRILSHPDFVSFKETDIAKYWLINIAAYSGARLEEISQMSPETDIYLKDGVWLYDFNEEDDKSLKNDPSKRKVPIHSELIRLGFLDYVEALKLKKAKRLFPDEKIRDGRTGKNAGKRVSRYIQNVVGIKGKSLHSFRHSVLTKFKRALIDEGVAAAIAGHEHGGITYSRYGKDYSVSALKNVVELIQY